MGSVTSLEAYRSINKKALQQRVYDYIAECGFRGATTDEVEEALSLAHQTVSPRVLELREAGLIEKTGDRRLTRSLRNADVYCVSKVASNRAVAVAA